MPRPSSAPAVDCLASSAPPFSISPAAVPPDTAISSFMVAQPKRLRHSLFA